MKIDQDIARILPIAQQNLIADFKRDEKIEGNDDETVEINDEENLDEPNHYFEDNDRSEFDFKIDTLYPSLYQLLSRLRIPVQFHINYKFEVRDLFVGGLKSSPVRRDIAFAIARHLANNKCLLEKRGDWIHIPAIKTDEELVKLAAESSDDLNLLSTRLKSYGTFYKSFAFLLPNLDIITPQALITPAKRNGAKRATLAAVLRVLNDFDFNSGNCKVSFLTIGGEEWSVKELTDIYNHYQRRTKNSS